MGISNAIDPGAVARVVGYSLTFADFSDSFRYLPQRIAIPAVIAEDKQAAYTDWNIRKTVSSVAEFLEEFGVCPAYYAMRILKPVAGGGVGSIPIDIYPVKETAGAKSTGDLTVVGTATKSVTHTVVFNGRKIIDGQKAEFSVTSGDLPAAINVKMMAAINAVVGASVDAVVGGSPEIATLTSKYQTLQSNEISITIDTGVDAAGVTYTLPTMAGGAGAIDLSTALANFGEIWATNVINTFDSTKFDDFAIFNGEPGELGGSGRWQAKVVKPFIAVLGTVLSDKAALIALMASRKSDMTNTLAPAPNSLGLTVEAAANMVVRFAPMMNAKPHSTIAEQYYPDMPSALNGDIGVMKNYDDRNDLVKDGCSTVTYDESNGFRVEDFITFRRLDSQPDTAKDFRYCRDIVGIDFNVAFGYRIIEELYLVTKTIANDSDVIDSSVSADVVKPKTWKAVIYDFFDDLSDLAIIADPSFSKNSLLIGIGENPKRFETRFNYKRTSTVRISSTTAAAGFNFG